MIIVPIWEINMILNLYYLIQNMQGGHDIPLWAWQDLISLKMLKVIKYTKINQPLVLEYDELQAIGRRSYAIYVIKLT